MACAEGSASRTVHGTAAVDKLSRHSMSSNVMPGLSVEGNSVGHTVQMGNKAMDNGWS